MKKIKVILFLLLTAPPVVMAQHGHGHNTDMIRPAHHHHDRNEIGISLGALYGIDDSLWGTGLHAHYFRTFSDHSRWAAGAFAEHAWIDQTHFSFGAGIRFEPVHRLSLGVFPGIITAKHNHSHHGHSHDEGWKTRFSIHFEVVCDLFYWKSYHLGPAFDYSWSKNDSHFMLGVHWAYCF
ncbi:MAG: hypothetical protein LIO77_10815 [Rikenellaceae bacterium]|nr:hypothetical protein [Rikenellaceae bacterium]